jgi:hypothetical protein
LIALGYHRQIRFLQREISVTSNPVKPPQNEEERAMAERLKEAYRDPELQNLSDRKTATPALFRPWLASLVHAATTARIASDSNDDSALEHIFQDSRCFLKNSQF